MKEIFIAFAKQNEETNKAFAAVLDKMTNDEREKNRKSYYGSLSGLMRHILGGTVFFLGMFTGHFAKNEAAQKALSGLKKADTLDGVKKLDEAQWKKICASLKIADKAWVDLMAALSEADFASMFKTDWYKNKPAEVPFWFMLEQLVTHNLHHRGQVSQILDTLKIENDYSGVNVKFL